MGPFLRYLFSFVALVIATNLCRGAEIEPLLDPHDLPPGALVVSTALTHSQRSTEQMMGGLALPAQSEHPEERALAQTVADLKRQLRLAEAKAYLDDPALLISDSYQEQAHEWVMKQHGNEFNASLSFQRSASATKDSQSQVNGMVDLIDMILFKELAGDPRWHPLFASLYDAVEGMVKTNKELSVENISRQLYSFARNDKRIGYSPDPPPPKVSSLSDYLEQLDKRYPLLLTKLDEFKKSSAIPADAFAGVVYGELYRLLDGIAQMSVEIRTPPEVKDLRQKLRGKVIELANLRSRLEREQPPE